MRRGAALVVLLCACGRIGFDGVVPGGDDVVPASGVALAYPTHTLNAIVDVTSIATTPSVATGGNLAFSSTLLPLGLALDPSTGEISGTPHVLLEAVPLTITATNANGSASFALELTALPGFLVDTTSDGSDDIPGDSVCASTAAGGCSIRAALQTIEQQPLNAYVILVPAGAYSLDTELDPFTRNVVIAGETHATTIAPSTVHGDYRFAHLSSGNRLRLHGLAFVEFGGNVEGGTLNVTDGDLYVVDSRFSKSQGNSRGGVLYIDNGSFARFSSCEIADNDVTNGNGWGGFVDGEGNNTQIELYGSVAIGNTAYWGSVAHITAGTAMKIVNSTLFRNESSISGTLASPGGKYEIANSTIAYNTNTSTNPNGNDASAGIYLFSTPASYDLTNTILAFNTLFDGTKRDCARRDLATTISTGGGNILSDDGHDCDALKIDRTLVDPLIEDTLADHGGATFMLGLRDGSPAIDSGVAAKCPSTDQRDAPRPARNGCDVGAFEAQ